MSTASQERPQQVTKRQLNQQTASVLGQVTESHDVIVTERGRPRWRIAVYDERPETPLARMEREGRYTPPAVDPIPWPEHPRGPAYTDADVDRLLDEMRGDH